MYVCMGVCVCARVCVHDARIECCSYSLDAETESRSGSH